MAMKLGLLTPTVFRSTFPLSESDEPLPSNLKPVNLVWVSARRDGRDECS